MASKAQVKETKQIRGSAQKRKKPAAQKSEVHGAKDKAAARQKAAAELAAELKKLRSAAKEAVRQLSLRIDSGIADSLRVLEKKQQPGEPCNLPGAKSTAQMAKKLRALKIKPAKGRLKDIAHIERMVEKIAEKTAAKKQQAAQ